MKSNPERKSKTEEEMFPMVEQWLSSGQDKNEFCRSHSIPSSLFNYWVSKYQWLKQELKEKGSDSFVSIKVKELALTGQDARQPLLEWNMPGGHQLKFYHPIDEELILSLLKQIK